MFAQKHLWRSIAITVTALLLSACGLTSPTTTSGSATTTPLPFTPVSGTAVPTPQGPLQPQLFDVAHFQAAYGVDQFIKQGITGKGQTVIDIVSFGSPTLNADVATFSQHFNLPAANIQVIAPIGTVPFDPTNHDMTGWQGETTLDVEIIHAMAPDAKIIVMTSPVSETEGTAGLPEFRQLIQYAADHHLGSIVSMSWGASEVSLKNDPNGASEVAKWDALLKQTTEQGMTYLASSGDLGATDYTDVQNDISPTRTVGFPADDPWVTSVGGTSLFSDGTAYREEVWNTGGASAGGFSTLFGEPDYQQKVAVNSPNPFQNQRGIPDVAADADPSTGLTLYIGGQATGAGGTSASAPAWAGIVALANQLAGHNLGFINPALYKLATSANYARDFHDISVGNNSVSLGSVSVQGFDASQGWDPTTGLGSPNTPNLLPDLIAASAGG